MNLTSRADYFVFGLAGLLVGGAGMAEAGGAEETSRPDAEGLN